MLGGVGPGLCCENEELAEIEAALGVAVPALAALLKSDVRHA